METKYENLVDVLDITALDIPWCRKGKHVECVSKWVIFSTLKHPKVGRLVSVHFETRRSANSVAKEFNDLTKVLPELNQKSHDPQGSSS